MKKKKNGLKFFENRIMSFILKKKNPADTNDINIKISTKYVSLHFVRLNCSIKC